MALEPAIVIADDNKGDSTGSSDSAMIAVRPGTDPESDVANSGTVRINSVSDAEGTTKLLRVIIYPPPHLRQQPVLLTVHTNTTALGIINKAATLFHMSPNSVSAHHLSFGTRNSQDLASTLKEIRVQDYGVIQLLARSSGVLLSLTNPLATSLDCGDRQFWENSGPRISSPHLIEGRRGVWRKHRTHLKQTFPRHNTLS